jgi:hypothetical protein
MNYKGKLHRYHLQELLSPINSQITAKAHWFWDFFTPD